MSGVTEHRETEFKFRVPADVTVDLEQILHAADARFTREPVRSMSATYYDTSNVNLLRWGITLRHRTGGDDDGWHMKIPSHSTGDTPARDEIRVDASTTSIPMELASIAAPLIRRQEIVAMAEVRTERAPFLVVGHAGDRLIEVVDDHVQVGTPGLEPSATFHEIEVELLEDVPESRHLARAIGSALLDAGTEASSVSKAAQALGRRASDPPDVPALDFPDSDAPAIDALQAIFSRYVRDLLLADVGVRRDLPDSVHQMRVSCRRLRGALTTFRPLLDPGVTSFLREELAWLAAELGQVRDTEVQIEVLGEGIADEAACEFVVNQLQQRLRAARSSALAALRSDRHDFLIEDLILLVSEPPVGSRAFETVDTVISECVKIPWIKLRRRVEKSDLESPAEQWHRIRIQAKKARYAFESVAPIFGEGYRKLGKSLAWVTDTLGSRQDAQVSMHTLEELAATAPGPIAYQLGVHAAHCEFAGTQDIHAFLDRWPAIDHQARKLGLG